MDRWFAYRSFRPQPEAMRTFVGLGADTGCIFPGNTLCSLGVPYADHRPLWVGPDLYDLESLDEQVSAARQAAPDARLLCLVDLNTPDWWVRLNGHGARNTDSFYELGRVAASDVWRRDTAEFLRVFLRHMQALCGPHMAGYILAGGNTTEWFEQGGGCESPSKRAAWRQWRLDHGHEDPVDIPPASLRERCSHGLLRDPVDDGLALDYWRFSHHLLADALLYYAGVAQSVLEHQVAVGAFFGYALELGRNQCVSTGHLAFDPVFRSPDIDFLIAPGSYMDRTMGGVGGFMNCLASIQHHGKMFLHEIDHRTHTARSTTLLGRPVPGHEQGWPDEPATIAGLRREFALAATHRTALWWFDMFGGWFEGEGVLAEIGRMRRIWDQLLSRDDESAAEVAVVFDSESMYHLDETSPLAGELFQLQRVGLYRAGAPHDMLSFGDLATIDWSRYRLVFFPNLFVVDDERLALLAQTVCRDGRTVVFGPTPGIVRNGRYNQAHVAQLTGIDGAVAALTTAEHDDWTAVLAPRASLEAATLRGLYQAAGVHVYADQDDPLYASRRLLAIHSRDGGPRQIHLPRRCRAVVELFSGRTVATDTASFEDVLACPDTRLYDLVD